MRMETTMNSEAAHDRVAQALTAFATARQVAIARSSEAAALRKTAASGLAALDECLAWQRAGEAATALRAAYLALGEAIDVSARAP